MPDKITPNVFVYVCTMKSPPVDNDVVFGFFNEPTLPVSQRHQSFQGPLYGH